MASPAGSDHKVKLQERTPEAEADMLNVLLLTVLPVQAPKPAATAYLANVDLIVVNRVRSHSTSYDEWGRAKRAFSEQWWVSFWEYVWVPMPNGVGAVPAACIDRGWWSCSNCRGFYRCSDGWMVESKDDLNVVGADLIVVDSPFDWEVKHRKVYKPISKPRK